MDLGGAWAFISLLREALVPKYESDIQSTVSRLFLNLITSVDGMLLVGMKISYACLLLIQNVFILFISFSFTC